ncbi:MAG: hypothetical protein K8M05_16470, partial [Deltaproteobacteria bacterium]|nr:hypothetical protein [Kofleriaceae bacterium]
MTNLLSIVPALAGVAVSAAMTATALAQPAPDPVRPLKVKVYAPAEGVEVAAAMAPPWCDVVPPPKSPSSSASRSSLERQFMVVDRSGWGGGTLEKIAAMLCESPEDESFQAQTGSVVQAWINVTGLGTQQAIASIRARVDTASWKRQRDETCAAVAVNPEASGRALELARVTARVFGCGSSSLGPFWSDDMNPPDKSLGWYLDEDAAPPSQTIASYRVLRCLPRASRAPDAHALGRYASCGVEARALDPGKLEAELASSGWNEFAKTIAREQHGFARRRVAQYDREVRALAAKDPAYQQIFYDAPEAAWKAWTELAAANRDALDAAFAYEARFVDNPGRATGCRAA